MYQLDLKKLSDQALAERAQHTIQSLLAKDITRQESRERLQEILDEVARRG